MHGSSQRPFRSAQPVLYFDDFGRRIRTRAQSLSSSLGLAAAAMAALRRTSMLAQVLFRISIELLLALGAAEIICLPFMLGVSSSGSRFYIQSADRIVHSCCGIHYDFLRFRIKVSNGRVVRLIKSAHSRPANRLYRRRLRKLK